jgi:acetoacetyl-CoA synthetase
MNKSQPIWTPKDDIIQQSHLKKFMADCGHIEVNYQEFWECSVDNSEEFWEKFWDYSCIKGDKGDIILSNPDEMIGGQFFKNGSLNYAENLLSLRNDQPAIFFENENGKKNQYSFKELYDQVSLWIQVLKDNGIKKGDRVAALMPNLPETVFAYLATASIGAIWSSASPDFGVQGIIDRFDQIEPKLFITVDGYTYSVKEIDCLEKVQDATSAIHSIENILVIGYIDENPDISKLNSASLISEEQKKFEPKEIQFEKLPFNYPLCIMFSSGTTGVPKCIVHGHGGTLIQHMKEHQLQCDIKAEDRVFYFTTCGWMMWNWLVSALASEATIVLYEGNPLYPNRRRLWDLVDEYKITLFGTAAKYIDALNKMRVNPKESHDLSSLKTITSTGSPLVHESFDYVYEHIKEDVHLASISGGTDIVSCFVLGNPISPVYRGEIQGAGLGMAITTLNSDGQEEKEGIAGEMVCTKPFPSMPIYFWNDDDGKKFKKAYFENYKNIWCHGDWIEKTDNNGFIIHGRSDATLNPGGVRIGTAEIYRQAEKIPEILESIAVGQDWKGDSRIVLFVRLQDDQTLTDDLIKHIKNQIKEGASPRHVPARIVEIADIPRTKSGKITELAVRDIIHGREVKNKEALQNPEALDLYKNLTQLR